MNKIDVQLFGASLVAFQSGALWWPEMSLLCVSDLHLGKSERIARLGGAFLPPYETEETLTRLEADIDQNPARIVIALGDSFDDMAAAQALAPEVVDRIIRLQAGRRWIWISGNHDPAPLSLAGEHLAQTVVGGLAFRHEAEIPAKAEVSGHYHPKARLSLKGRGYSRPCFLFDQSRLILPAYGTYTGGLRTNHDALCELMDAKAEVILTGKHMARIPMPR